MDMIDSGYTNSSSEKLMYTIYENGFDIYIEGSTHPFIHQPEPFIPYPNMTYEENARTMCKELSTESEAVQADLTFNERLTNVEANIDYLMLLTDADSATEEETE